MGGHLGQNIKRGKVEKPYNWPRVSTDVNYYVKSCDRCQRTKYVNLQKTVVILYPVSVPNIIWSQIGINLMGTLKEMEHSYRFIMTFIDYFTKYPEIIALKIKSAKEVGHHLYRSTWSYGCPDIIISAQGSFLGLL